MPVSEIAGNPDIFVRSGAPINLTCLISSSPEPPAFVFWYHNNRMINYDYNGDSKGQITVQKDAKRSDVVTSRLLIKKARLDDSGNYTCSPSNAEPASSYVHVLQGKCPSISPHNEQHSGGTYSMYHFYTHSAGIGLTLIPLPKGAHFLATACLAFEWLSALKAKGGKLPLTSGDHPLSNRLRQSTCREG